MKPRTRSRIGSMLVVITLISFSFVAISGCGPAKTGVRTLAQVTLAAGQQVANIWPLGPALLYKSLPTTTQFDRLLLPSGESVEVPGLVTSQLQAAISPDGKTAAYHDGASLILRPLPNGTTTRVPLPDSAGSPDIIRWSPDSKYVLFRWTTNEFDGSVASRIYRVDPGDKAPTEVYREGRSEGMSTLWSPDGKTVAIVTLTAKGNASLSSTILTYQPATGTVKTELADQSRVYSLDWSRTPPWQPMPTYRTDAQDNHLVPCDSTSKVARTTLPVSNMDLIGYSFTLIQVQDAAGKVLRELDLTPVLKSLGFDASRFNTVFISPSIPLPGTSQWVLGVHAYKREGQGYSDVWQAYLCYDGDSGTVRTFNGDEQPIADGLSDGLSSVQGAEGSMWLDGRMYLVKSTPAGRSLLVLDPVGATAKRLATLSAERTHVLLWDRTLYCADSKAVWAIGVATGGRRDIARAPTDWRIVPESIWALNNRAGDQLRWARTKVDANSQQPLQVTIEAATISATK